MKDEDHILLCKTLNTEQYEVSFTDVYGNTDKQYRVTQIMKHDPSLDGPVYQSNI